MASVDFGKQIGPLPLGAWIVVVGTGVGIAVYNRRSGTGVAPEIVEDNSGTPGVGLGGSGMGWVDVAPPATGPVSPQPVDNDAWGKAAINELIAQGYDAALADQAIRTYLAANQLSTQQYALVRIALNKLGSPPSPLPPGPSVPAPPVLPKPTPTPGRYVTTGKFGLAAGHPVSIVYLVGLGYLKGTPSGIQFTGKGGLPRNHPWSYTYAAGIGFIRRVA
jgi:hypothetical protein